MQAGVHAGSLSEEELGELRSRIRALPAGRGDREPVAHAGVAGPLFQGRTDVTEAERHGLYRKGSTIRWRPWR